MKLHPSKRILKQHIACPFCRSSDAFVQYADGHGYCFSCRTRKPPEGFYRTFRPKAPEPPSGLALKLFEEALSADQPVVRSYFRSRNLHLLEDCHHVLRFHPDCPFGKGQRHPSLVALYREINSDEPRAIHRTALTSDGRKIDRKALGPKDGCAIKLSRDEDVHEGLTIGEGIETTLAAMQLLPNFTPAWALGDAGSIAKFPLLPGIESLTILVDNDRNGVGPSSALECSRRWTSYGREVFRVVPAAIDADMADIIGEVAA